ncbi:MAG: hypothetical protein COB85_01230 [Bacteroidetes bacterium]|nr:MAG: hypothetical protein COB85_01230 [Bacteroidota bacterium]
MQKTSLSLFGHVFAESFTLDQEFRLPSVMRNDACLAYVHTGKQEVYSSTQKLVIKDRESILMKCGNYIANFVDITPTSQFKSVIFHLDPESIKKAFGDKDLSFLKISERRKGIDPALKIDRSSLLDSFVQSMQPYFENPDLANEALLSVKLQELVYILSNSGKNQLATQIIGTLYSPEEIAFNEIIEANIYHSLSISELAHLTLRSDSTFKRDFQKWYKQSPAKYFKTKRLEKAAELLTTTSLQINEIAWDSGFENAAHFSDSFHTHFGKSPKEYRI